MKANKVREMSNEELVAKLTDLKKELFNLRLSHASGQLTNNTALAIAKKISLVSRPLPRERTSLAGK